jgi:hypothetical protein
MERKKILIATKTYPSISQTYKETVCTAGILLDDNEQPLRWIRIYPIRYRKLEFDQRYPRWSIISAMIEKNHKDNRLESYRIDDSSIEVIKQIDTKNNWQARKDLVLPLEFATIKEIQEKGLSLGIIKAKTIVKHYFQETEREWPQKQQAIQDQLDLFEIPVDLEKIPYKFGYEFIEKDDTHHKFSISDWEISELYRKCRDKSQATTIQEKEKEAINKVCQKLEELSSKDLYFIVGNLHGRRHIFMIIGLFYPALQESDQLRLF